MDGISFITCRQIRRILIGILNDTGLALEVRERATEMLHLHESRETVEACAGALQDQNAGIRFWAAYTLGTVPPFHRKLSEFAVSALHVVLDDNAIVPGWWSVGQEAKAAIVGLRNDPCERDRLQSEFRYILQDVNASAEDRSWAECYCLSQAIPTISNCATL